MKYTRILSLVSIFILLAILVPSAYAGPPAGDWVSGITCQNLGTGSANVTLYFYQEGNGSPVLTYTDPNPVLVGTSRLYYTPTNFSGLPANFLGSAVVSANQPMACLVNTATTGTGTTSSPFRLGTSSGFDTSQTGPKMYVPHAAKNYSGWNTYLAVQNTSASNVSVTVTYKDRFGTAYPGGTQTGSIPGYSNKIFYLNDNAGLPNGFLGAAIVSADDNTTPLAVTVNTFNSGSNSSTSQVLSFSGFSDGANKLLIPRVVRNYYGYNSGISIQNIGTNPTTVRVTFTINGTDYVYNSAAINAGFVLALYTPSVTQLNPIDGLPVSFRTGSAVVEVLSGGPVVAVVNEDNPGGAGIPVESAGTAATYGAINDGLQTTTVFFPQLSDKAGGYWVGGLQISNTTNTAGTCNISYDSDTDANELNVPLAGNGVIKRYLPNVTNLNDGYNASVTVTCTQPVVGLGNNVAMPNSGKRGDSLFNNTGLNQ